jgi:hypothetical protein
MRQDAKAVMLNFVNPAIARRRRKYAPAHENKDRTFSQGRLPGMSGLDEFGGIVQSKVWGTFLAFRATASS